MTARTLSASNKLPPPTSNVDSFSKFPMAGGKFPLSPLAPGEEKRRMTVKQIRETLVLCATRMNLRRERRSKLVSWTISVGKVPSNEFRAVQVRAKNAELKGGYELMCNTENSTDSTVTLILTKIKKLKICHGANLCRDSAMMSIVSYKTKRGTLDAEMNSKSSGAAIEDS